MSDRPPQLAPHRLLAALLLPLALYTVLRIATGSATSALALTEAIPASALVIRGIIHQRIDPIGIVSTGSVAIALAVYAISGGDPIALKLRHGAVTGALGIAALASLALGRPLLLVVAEHRAAIDQDAQRRAAIEKRLGEPDRRRALVVMTFLVGMALTLDGVVQTALAFTVSTSNFVAASTAAHFVVLGGGIGAVAWYFRHQKLRRTRRPEAGT